MRGITGTGFYSQIRCLMDEIRRNRQHLDNAPLGPVQRKRLEERIANARAKLKEVRAALRVTKKA